MRIDVTDRSVPKNYPKALGDYCGPGPPCVPLFPYGGNRLITSSVGNKDQFVIVDVEGEPVVIDVVAPAGNFDEFLPKAQKALETVEWRGG